jgi:caa(3)-type oxidase subunit IV
MNNQKNIHPISTYVSVWLGLLVLTGAMTTAAVLNLGYLSRLAVILVAAVMCTLVVRFFMQIKPVDRAFKIMLVMALLMLVVIMLLTFTQ